MTSHGPEELERAGKRVRANTRASLMSDTKWRKLLEALDEAPIELSQCVVKFVGRPDEHVIRRSIGLHPPRPWVDTFAFGPISLRSIEWMLFPRTAAYQLGDRTIPKRAVEQDVDAAAQGPLEAVKG